MKKCLKLTFSSTLWRATLSNNITAKNRYLRQQRTINTYFGSDVSHWVDWLAAQTYSTIEQYSPGFTGTVVSAGTPLTPSSTTSYLLMLI